MSAFGRTLSEKYATKPPSRLLKYWCNAKRDSSMWLRVMDKPRRVSVNHETCIAPSNTLALPMTLEADHLASPIQKGSP